MKGKSSIFETNKAELRAAVQRFTEEHSCDALGVSSIWRFFLSPGTRPMYNRLIASKQQVNPNAYKATKEYREACKQYPQFASVPESALKSRFHEGTTSLNFAELRIVDPPLGALKSRANVKFIDLTGAVIRSKDVFKKFLLFKQLTSLSLSNCGLLEIPKKLPPTLRNLDLSHNYISEIVAASNHWEQFERLNLSQNSFTEWPQDLNPVVFPNLVFLSIAWNKIENPNPLTIIMCFPKLLYLDLSYCSLLSYPKWLISSRSIHILNIAGNSEIVDFSMSMLAKMGSLKWIDISNVFINQYQDEEKNFPSSLDKIISKENNYQLIEINNCSVVFK